MGGVEEMSRGDGGEERVEEMEGKRGVKEMEGRSRRGEESKRGGVKEMEGRRGIKERRSQGDGEESRRRGSRGHGNGKEGSRQWKGRSQGDGEEEPGEGGQERRRKRRSGPDCPREGALFTFLHPSCLSFSRFTFRHSSTCPVCSWAAASSAQSREI